MAIGGSGKPGKTDTISPNYPDRGRVKLIRGNSRSMAFGHKMGIYQIFVYLQLLDLITVRLKLRRAGELTHRCFPKLTQAA